jgi:anti-sigma B factor antagonist
VTTAESPFVSVARRSPGPAASDNRTVVVIRGEHDITTVDLLTETMGQAMALDDVDLVIDLSGVEFMDASTVGTLVGARNLLRARARALTLAVPSIPARRILELCDLADLIEAAQTGLASARSVDRDARGGSP